VDELSLTGRPTGGAAHLLNETTKHELKIIRDKLLLLEQNTVSWLDREARERVFNARQAGVTAHWVDRLDTAMSTAGQVGPTQQGSARYQEKARRIANVFATEPSLQGVLDVPFNAKVFSHLEKLSARVHMEMIEGRLQRDVAQQQEFINIFKNETTDFLTGSKVWTASPRHYGGFHPFGDPKKLSLTSQKLKANHMLSLRDGDYEHIIKEFGEIDPIQRYKGSPIYRPDKVKLEKLMRGVNHSNYESTLESLSSYIKHSKDVLKYTRDHYNTTPGVAANWINAAVDGAEVTGRNIDDHIHHLKTNMEPALRYADALKKEHYDMNAGHIAKAMIPGWGSGAIASITGLTGGGPTAIMLAALATRAPALAQTRMALTPMRTAVRLQNFYLKLHRKNQKNKDWIRGYVRKFGTSSFIGRATVTRWPRLFTSNAIARHVTDKNQPEYRHFIGRKPDNRYGRAEYRVTKAIVDALAKNPGMKERLIEEIAANISNYAPIADPLLRKGLESYINLVTKALPRTVNTDMFSEEIEPSDSEIQAFSEKLAVYEYGAGAIFRSMAEETLSYNEWEALEESAPQTASMIQQVIITEMASLNPEDKGKFSQGAKDQLSLAMGVDRLPPQVHQVLRNTFAPKEEGKPGPKAAPQWKEGRFPASRLSGTRAVEHRRT